MDTYKGLIPVLGLIVVGMIAAFTFGKVIGFADGLDEMQRLQAPKAIQEPLPPVVVRVPGISPICRMYATFARDDFRGVRQYLEVNPDLARWFIDTGEGHANDAIRCLGGIP